MNKKDIIVAGIVCGLCIGSIFLGRFIAITALVNFLCGGFVMWYFLMRKGVLG